MIFFSEYDISIFRKIIIFRIEFIGVIQSQWKSLVFFVKLFIPQGSTNSLTLQHAAGTTETCP